MNGSSRSTERALSGLAAWIRRRFAPSHSADDRPERAPDRVCRLTGAGATTGAVGTMPRHQDSSPLASGGARARRAAGTSDGSPRYRRIRAVTVPDSRSATSRSRPPHRGQASTSTSNARCIRSAQRRPAGPCGVAAAPPDSAPAGGAAPPDGARASCSTMPTYKSHTLGIDIGVSSITVRRDNESRPRTWPPSAFALLSRGTLLYVAAEGGGGGPLVANRGSIRPWERFDLVSRFAGSNLYALQVNNGQYVAAEGGGGGAVNANRNQVGAWEEFLMESPGGTLVAFRTANGYYLRAAVPSGLIDATATNVGPWRHSSWSSSRERVAAEACDARTREYGGRGAHSMPAGDSVGLGSALAGC